MSTPAHERVDDPMRTSPTAIRPVARRRLRTSDYCAAHGDPPVPRQHSGMAGLTLTFARPSGSPLVKGPCALLRLEGELMRGDGPAPFVARHRDHYWELEGEQFTRAQSDESIVVCFERMDGTASPTYGPYSGFSFQDGVAFVEHRLFAFADRSLGDWYSHEGGKHWHIMLITPAA